MSPRFFGRMFPCWCWGRLSGTNQKSVSASSRGANTTRRTKKRCRAVIGQDIGCALTHSDAVEIVRHLPLFRCRVDDASLTPRFSFSFSQVVAEQGLQDSGLPHLSMCRLEFSPEGYESLSPSPILSWRLALGSLSTGSQHRTRSPDWLARVIDARTGGLCLNASRPNNASFYTLVYLSAIDELITITLRFPPEKSAYCWSRHHSIKPSSHQSPFPQF